MKLRFELISLGVLMLGVGPLSNAELRPTSIPQGLACVGILAACLVFAGAASLWWWKPLIARVGYYRACAIFCAGLFCLIGPLIACMVALSPFTPFYKDVTTYFAMGASIGSWFISIDRWGSKISGRA